MGSTHITLLFVDAATHKEVESFNLVVFFVDVWCVRANVQMKGVDLSSIYSTFNKLMLFIRPIFA